LGLPPVPCGDSARDIPAILCAQPRESCWRTQEDVELDLGLEKQAISKWFKKAGGMGATLEGKKCYVDGKKQLAAAGVYRHPGSSRPTRVWWLALTGNVGEAPIFEDRGEGNSFRLKAEVAGGISGTETPAAVAEDEDTVGAAATAEDGEASAADPEWKNETTRRRCVLLLLIVLCTFFLRYLCGFLPRQCRRLTLL